MNFLQSKPVKAFIEQNHKAHITCHTSMLQDPHVQQLIAQDPQQGQQISGAIMAHVMEHLGMEYKRQIEESMGIQLPIYEDGEGNEVDQKLPPEVNDQIAQQAAQAAQQMLQQHQQAAQQQQAQQAAQDPIIQLQQQEVQIKMQEQQRKAQKDQQDFQIKQLQLQIEQQRIMAQQETEGAKIAMQAHLTKGKDKVQQEIEGARLAIDVGKQREQHAHLKEVATMQTDVQKELAAKQAEAQAKTKEMKKETPKTKGK